jgi:hypothetical protein
MKDEEGNTLKSFGNHEGLKALPRNAVESSMKTGIFTPSYEMGCLNPRPAV